MIDVPIHCDTGKLTMPYIGDELTINYSDNGRRYVFQASVLGHIYDPLPQIVIKKPLRREIGLEYEESYFRLQDRLELAVKGSKGLHIVVLTDEVSGGSVSFSCDRTVGLQQNEDYHCWLLLHTSKGKPVIVRFQAEMFQSMPLGETEQIVHMNFTKIKEQQRQELMKYCFEKQLRERKA